MESSPSELMIAQCIPSASCASCASSAHGSSKSADMTRTTTLSCSSVHHTPQEAIAEVARHGGAAASVTPQVNSLVELLHALLSHDQAFRTASMRGGVTGWPPLRHALQLHLAAAAGASPDGGRSPDDATVAWVISCLHQLQARAEDCVGLDGAGSTLLHTLCSKGKPTEALVKALEALGCDPQAVDASGRRPIDYVADHESLDEESLKVLQ